MDDRTTWLVELSAIVVATGLLATALTAARKRTETPDGLPLSALFEGATKKILSRWPKAKFLRQWWAEEGQKALERLRQKERALTPRFAADHYTLRNEVLQYWSSHLNEGEMNWNSPKDAAYWLFEGLDQAEEFLDAIDSTINKPQMEQRVRPIRSKSEVWEVISLGGAPGGTPSNSAA